MGKRHPRKDLNPTPNISCTLYHVPRNTRIKNYQAKSIKQISNKIMHEDECDSQSPPSKNEHVIMHIKSRKTATAKKATVVFTTTIAKLLKSGCATGYAK